MFWLSAVFCTDSTHVELVNTGHRCCSIVTSSPLPSGFFFLPHHCLFIVKFLSYFVTQLCTVLISFLSLSLCRTLTFLSATTVTSVRLHAFTSTNWPAQKETHYTCYLSSGPAWWNHQVNRMWCNQSPYSSFPLPCAPLLLSCAARCVHKKLKYSTSQHRVCTAHQCQCQWQPIKKKETDLMVLRLPSSFEAGRCDRGGRTNLNKVDISGLTTQQMKECCDLKTSSFMGFLPSTSSSTAGANYIWLPGAAPQGHQLFCSTHFAKAFSKQLPP